MTSRERVNKALSTTSWPRSRRKRLSPCTARQTPGRGCAGERLVNSRQRCLAAIHGEPVDRTPVFPLVMHLAADRCGFTYRQFAQSGEALAAAQIHFYRTFGVDAITACSDAFRITADLGGEIVFPEQQPPHLERPLVTCAADVVKLGRPDPARVGSRMADRVKGVADMVRDVGHECLVLGWVDMPFAEACSACGVQDFMMLLWEYPDLAHRLLDHLTGCVIDFALAQLAVGAPMVGCGDAAASLVPPRDVPRVRTALRAAGERRHPRR